MRAGLVERAEDWRWSSVRARLHPDDLHVLPLDAWPIPRPVDWLDRVNQALTGAEIEALRRAGQSLCRSNSSDSKPHCALVDDRRKRRDRLGKR
jgi:hypothetical protein